MPTMKIGLAQMRCEKGAIEGNLANIGNILHEAARRSVDIVCFPEMSITGYINPTQQPEAIVRLDGPEVARFVAQTGDTGLTAIAGIVEANPDGKPFITQVVARNGELLGFYRKITVADDEVEWFAPGAAVPAFQHAKGTFSIAICADIGNATVFERGAQAGARVIFEAAAPGLYGEQATRNWQSGFDWWRGECHTLLSRYARENGVFVVAATQAGRTVDEDFPGGGYVFGPDGACLAETSDWSEQMLYASLELE